MKAAVNIGFAVAIAILAAVAWFTLSSAKRLIESQQSVTHTHRVEEQLSLLSDSLFEAESGRRGHGSCPSTAGG